MIRTIRIARWVCEDRRDPIGTIGWGGVSGVSGVSGPPPTLDRMLRLACLLLGAEAAPAAAATTSAGAATPRRRRRRGRMLLRPATAALRDAQAVASSAASSAASSFFAAAASTSSSTLSASSSSSAAAAANSSPFFSSASPLLLEVGAAPPAEEPAAETTNDGAVDPAAALAAVPAVAADGNDAAPMPSAAEISKNLAQIAASKSQLKDMMASVQEQISSAEQAFNEARKAKLAQIQAAAEKAALDNTEEAKEVAESLAKIKQRRKEVNACLKMIYGGSNKFYWHMREVLSRVQPQKACSIVKNTDLPKLSLDGFTEKIYEANRFEPPETDGTTIRFFDTVKAPLFRCMCENVEAAGVVKPVTTSAPAGVVPGAVDAAEELAAKAQRDLAKMEAKQEAAAEAAAAAGAAAPPTAFLEAGDQTTRGDGDSGIDNDSDGLIDCDEPDCDVVLGCTEPSTDPPATRRGGGGCQVAAGPRPTLPLVLFAIVLGWRRRRPAKDAG